MESKAASTTVTLSPHELNVSLRQIARYAGGARYQADAAQQKFIGIVREKARELLNPALVYRVYEVTGTFEEGYVKFHDGGTFPVPAGEFEVGIKYLVFCVLTIGGRLEETVRTSMSAGDAVFGLFLDAAGVAFLEALGETAYETLQRRAREHSLHAGCRFGPGFKGLDLSFQKRLFDLVDASSIGVEINESCVMTPAKSLSFISKWATSPILESRRYKCASCAQVDCPYRIESMPSQGRRPATPFPSSSETKRRISFPRS